MTGEFTGAKVAILWRGAVLSLLRDDRPDILWPNCWDLPGGGREGVETPWECLRREICEETGIDLPRDAIRHFARHGAGPEATWFAVAELDLGVRAFRLGSEGRALMLMPIPEFLGRADVIPMFRDRLRVYLDGCGRGAGTGRHRVPDRHDALTKGD